MGRLKSVLKKLFFLPPLPTAADCRAFFPFGVHPSEYRGPFPALVFGVSSLGIRYDYHDNGDNRRRGGGAQRMGRAAPDQKAPQYPAGWPSAGGCRLPFGNHTARRPVCQPFVCGAEPVFRHPGTGPRGLLLLRFTMSCCRLCAPCLYDTSTAGRWAKISRPSFSAIAPAALSCC